MAAALALAIGSTSVQANSAHAHGEGAGSSSTPTVQATMALRDLWVGHVFWVRGVVSETIAGNAAAAKAAEAQVVANAKLIAAAIEPFYGQAAADKLFSLLAGHYGAVKAYLDASDKAGQDAAMQKLTGNAEEIAVFLSGANPNLPVDTLHGLLMGHGGHHLQQIQQLRDKQYPQEAQTWEAMKNHMYVVADALAGALAKQFPEKF